ncbi:MAG: SpoIIE family protein phosphatase, partial [Treponema sp.]|nr:SpoIIE family protein phosphatase [Treponema sp.]
QTLYWEAPRLFSSTVGSFPVSAFTDDFSVLAWQEARANRDTSITGSGVINIGLAVKISGQDWQRKANAGGPYMYSGTEPSILSMAIDQKGRLLIAVAASTTQTEILISDDKGESFSRNSVSLGSESSVAPRIYVRADGGYLLFITRGSEQTLSIYYSQSQDGITWSPFELFVREPNLQLNFLPAHASIGSRDFVFFQSFVSDANVNPSFQLFYKTSDDGGKTWSTAKLFTSFKDPVMYTDATPDRFDNQRPNVVRYGNNLFLVWERRYSARPPQVYGAIIDRDGNIQDQAQRINTEEVYCNNPIAFMYEGSPAVVWFDNRKGGNRVFLARPNGILWQNIDLSGSTGEASFARTTVDRDDLYVFWQSAVQGSSRIYSLQPDKSVDPPKITTINFTPSGRGRGERVRLSWSVPQDTSGIHGFSWVWSQSADAQPEKTVMVYNANNPADRSLELSAPDEGSWYFSVIAQDFAGNWSQPARVEYIHDTTPPPQVVIDPPAEDDNGFLVSNDITVSWQPPDVPDVAGYSWRLEYLGANTSGQAAGRAMEAPPARIMGSSASVSFKNQDNGLWGFTVTAIDQVGNIGPAASITFRTNKYIPYTLVTNVDSSQDVQGLLSIRITGRGFAVGGTITKIMLDRDGNAPYDREFSLADGDYTINSDREISGLRVDNLDAGMYRLILIHSGRGTYMTAPLISVDRKGTVKFGDYGNEWKPSWAKPPERRFVIDPVMYVIVAVVLLCIFGLIGAIRQIGGVIAEGAAVRVEAAALFTGDYMPLEKKKRSSVIRKRGLGLRFKLASFTIVLVLVVVTMVSVPLYYMMTRTQRETLLQSLWDRSGVLLEGLASSTRAYLPMANPELELINLPAQMAAIPEAHYVTITGYGSGTTIYNDYVWASNDPDILSKIDTTDLRPGISRIQDELSGRLVDIGTELNSQARSAVGDLSKNITDLTQEAVSLALKTDAESQRRMNDIQVTTRTFQSRITAALSEIGKGVGSQPEFSTSNLPADRNRNFILFKPVMFRQGSDDNYFRGLIRLEISIDSIQAQITSGQRQLLITILVIAAIVIIIGTIGALILSTLIIRPIRKLVSYVERIRDTEDKSKLAGVDIYIKSKDEIASLGNTINEMAHGLVTAAAAASDLSIGKEIQKKFIPLDTDREGNKLTSGFKDTKNTRFFGYYEGAKGVSGDYFDYQDLDGRYYAIIKCDVAGKGIPAALIMIQVATMFLNYFKQWKVSKNMHIEELVYQINEFIETLGFKGRFAAFTLCLFDSETGVTRFCNAGDNIVHYYDASEGKVKSLTLPETPATGVLPNFLVESKGGYSVQKMTLDRGDILFMYTDGIEEAKRKFRDSGFKEIICNEGPTDTVHGNHVSGQGDEELGPERVREIINAVMNKQTYTLQKWHNGEGDKELKFDFSVCEGTVEEVIMAMVSVEKMFRCYKDPKAGEDSRVLVDKKIDEFLRKHFIQYRTYCSFTHEYPGSDAYLYYTHVSEDDQYDDLTILGLKRK